MDILQIWNSVVVLPLMLLLQQLADLATAISLPAGGVAIILMTIIIKGLLLPLSLKQTASMKAMQAVQPEIQALRKKYGKDRERITQETMRLYKERGVNPAAGCLPMIPMMVVLIGLYGALINLAQCDPNREAALQCDPRFAQDFLWVSRLDLPDVFTIPGLEFALPGILPIAMAITQYFSSKMMTMPSQDPQQQMMNRMMTVMMPAMMLFWGVTFPAGLVLYWFISNVFEMVRLYFTVGPKGLQSAAAAPAAALVDEQANGAKRSGGGNGAVSATETGSETPGRGPRADGKPSRSRQKRGKRGRR